MHEAELVRAWQAGDRMAGETLCKRHYDTLEKFFRNKVAEPVDFIHETFLACIEQVGCYREEASFRTYILAIANNLVRKHYRMKAGPRGKVDLGSISVEDFGESPSLVLADSEAKHMLLAALRRLSLEHQILIELYYWEQLKTAEMAEVLDIPIGTVKTRLRAARARLEQIIATMASSPELSRDTGDLFEQWVKDVRDSRDEDEDEGGDD